MNRTYLYPKWLYSFLLLLFLLEAKAQTEFEYWFDSYSDPKTISLRISNGTFSPSLDANNLSQGFHTLNMRLRDADGMYSPVSTSTFFKYSGTGISTIEYWFEDDAKHIGTTIIDADYEDVQIVDLDLSDVEKFPLGVHQLNMRVAVNGGFYSPVYSTLILRMPNGTGDSVLEYWFDENISKKAATPVNTKWSIAQELDLDLTNAEYFPLGFHKLNMRIASNGNQYSPIYTAYVMKLPQGSTSQLTYWLDDDYKNGRHVVSSKVTNGLTTVFMPALDFSAAASGMHRLKFRITANGFDNGVIYEVPVLITRRYNNDGVVTVVGESRWLDDVSPMEYAVSNPQSIVTRSYTLDPSNFTVGQHAFHVQYKNSAQVWGEQNVTYFYKDAATGRLYEGIMPMETEGIEAMSTIAQVYYAYKDGTIFVDCQSADLGSTGAIFVYDLFGKMIAKEVVSNSNGIHAEINVENIARQMLIVKMVSGKVNSSKKIMPM